MLSLVKAGSFYVTSCFDETRLLLIHIDQKARIRIMSGDPTLTGPVVRIARGITTVAARIIVVAVLTSLPVSSFYAMIARLQAWPGRNHGEQST